MNQDTEEFAGAADKRAKTVVGISGGLLLLLPGFIRNFDLPHDEFWLLAASAGLAGVSLFLATVAFLIADANSRRIALNANTNWPGYHVTYGLAVCSFSMAIIAFAAFSIINASDFSQSSFRTIDIVLDKPVAAPEEIIELKAVLDETVKPDSFKWTASDGMLLDDDEGSVAWLSPPGIAESAWIEIDVTVQADGVIKTESTRILFISPIDRNPKANWNPGRPSQMHAARHAVYPLADSLGETRSGLIDGSSAEFSSLAWCNQSPHLSSNAELRLPGPRECCSTSIKVWPLCDPAC